MVVVKSIIVTLGATILLFLFATLCRADFKLLELDKLSLEYHNYVAPGTDLLLYPEKHKEAINVLIDVRLLKFAYWDNKILSSTTDGQYRSIGLNTEMGIKITRHVDIFFNHISLHLIDRPHSFLPKFPTYDSVGLRLNLFINPNQRKSIF